MMKNFSIERAQSNMSIGHAYGFIGILVSSIIWFISALVSASYSPMAAIWSLLIGGALISPITKILNSLLKLKGHDAENPLKKLAMENTIWMIMCIPLAYALSTFKIEWFFQGMLLIIGGRYLTFQTIFGHKIYWFLGLSLGVASFVMFKFKIQPLETLLIGSIIELVFGSIIFFLYTKKIVNS